MEEHNRATVERATAAATAVLGSRDAARLYMQITNFALGGVAPLDLLKPASGKAVVMQELQTHRDSGPALASLSYPHILEAHDMPTHELRERKRIEEAKLREFRWGHSR